MRGSTSCARSFADSVACVCVQDRALCPLVDSFWGVREKISDLEQLRCKANLISTRRRYVIGRWGEAAAAELAGSLSPTLRHHFEGTLMPFSWLPMARLCAIDCAISERLMRGDATEMRKFGGAVAQLDLEMYRTFFRLGTPEFFLSKGRFVLNLYFSAGTIESDISAGQGRMTMKDVVLPAYMCRDGITGYVEFVMRASGANGLRVSHGSCVHRDDPFCTYEASWT